ncbi:hypothetical protein FisN_15Lh203 [Fistulifera solaris]|uniref:VTT domain-containing protein n=1 Tax=Fistulifera solaris TaxID=1519565 RepID=A0A1Z5JDM8_FISSO|nr:hypothetical protein FisN_15Lh203 [Fistulifera solaris]|eukprot:GAX12104.1 hypothetical protein FisN_15Lh203 [Fistulifera solaris]
MSIRFFLLIFLSLQSAIGFTPRSADKKIRTTFSVVNKQQPLTEISSREHSLVSQKFGIKNIPPEHGVTKLLDVSDVTSSSINSLKQFDTSDPQSTFALIASFLVFTSLVIASQTVGWEGMTQGLSDLMADPKQSLQAVIDYVQDAGPMGPLIFGAVYLLAEILAVPATPLTLSAGYLFGFPMGSAIVLVAATLAASAAFFIGKTFLRQWVEQILADNAKLAKIDKAIGREGFRLLLLVRLSPLFPFALSNYVYGASSIEFVPYFFGTLFGFAPGTMGMVYAGMVGRALTTGDGTQPWYVYAVGCLGLGLLLKLITDVAGNIVNSMEDDADIDIEEAQ